MQDSVLFFFFTSCFIEDVPSGRVMDASWTHHGREGFFLACSCNFLHQDVDFFFMFCSKNPELFQTRLPFSHQVAEERRF